MLHNDINNENLIEQMLQNSKKNTTKNQNLQFKEQLFSLIDAMLKESENRGCFCYFITIKIKEEKEICTVLDIIQNLTDTAFYSFTGERLGNGQLYIRFFLAIRNLIGYNACIANNIRGRFLYEELRGIDVLECRTLGDKTTAFKYVIEPIFVSNTNAIFIYNANLVLIFGAFLMFISENNIGIIKHKIWQPDNNSPVFLSLDSNTDAKNLTPIHIRNLFRLYFEEKKWYINGSNIYESIPNTQMSVRYVRKFNQIEALYEDIITWMLEKHWTTFFNFDFISLKLGYLKKFTENFLKLPETIVQTINISFDIIEFTDGIYILSTANFLNKTSASTTISKIKKKILNVLRLKRIKTIIYCFKTYKQKKNFGCWINLLEEKKVNLIEIQRVFTDFATYVHHAAVLDNNIKQALVIFRNGISMLLKTTVSTEFLVKYFLIKKIALIIQLKILEVNTGSHTLETFNNNATELLEVNSHTLKKLVIYLYNKFIYLVVYCNKFMHKKNKKSIRTLLIKLKNKYDIEEAQAEQYWE